MLRLGCLLTIGLSLGVAAAQPAAPQRTAPEEEREEAASREELFQRDSGLLVPGTNVHLHDMVVRAKSGQMVRVAYGRREIFVAPIDPSALRYVAIGAKVDVRGTLVEAPSAGQARLVYAMNAREARRLARQRVYVDAWSFAPVE